jgi:hypothetical protein
LAGEDSESSQSTIAVRAEAVQAISQRGKIDGLELNRKAVEPCNQAMPIFLSRRHLPIETCLLRIEVPPPAPMNPSHWWIEQGPSEFKGGKSLVKIKLAYCRE